MATPILFLIDSPHKESVKEIGNPLKKKFYQKEDVLNEKEISYLWKYLFGKEYSMSGRVLRSLHVTERNSPGGSKESKNKFGP